MNKNLLRYLSNMKSLKSFLICSLFLTVFVLFDSKAFAQSIDEETGLPDYNRWDVIAIEIENDISAGELSSSRLNKFTKVSFAL